jgi:hypothetical protein
VAIQRLRQQAGAGSFANAARAGEEIRVMQPLMLDRVAECTCDRLLACYFVKRLWAPFTRDYLIGHVERFVFTP